MINIRHSSCVFLTLYSVIGFMLASLVSCSSSTNFDKIPQTRFITHYQENENGRVPFLSYWEHGSAKEWDERVEGLAGKKQILYIKDINIDYINPKPTTTHAQKDLEDLRIYFRRALYENIKKAVKVDRNFIPEIHPSRNAYTLEIAITSITPTAAAVNFIMAGVDNLTPVPASAVGKFIREKGHIAIAAKLTDNHGRVIAEMADYREDHSALFIDFKDFTRYRHHKKHIDDWAKEITILVTHPAEYRLAPPSRFSINPF